MATKGSRSKGSKSKAKAKAKPRLVDVETLAGELNLTTRRISQLVDEGAIPRFARGQYDLDRCFRAYVRYLQKCLEKKAVPIRNGEANINQIRVRRELAEAELKELELAEKQKNLISIEDLEKEMSDLVLTTKARILGVPARLAPELVGEESRVMIQAKIEKALKEALQIISEAK